MTFTFIILAITVYYWGGYIVFSVLPLHTTIFDYFMPLNKTRPKSMPYRAKYPFDQEQYFYRVFFNILVSTGVIQTATLCMDMMYLMIVYHVSGKFALIQ